MHTTVHRIGSHDIYIGRPRSGQPWGYGSPFIIGRDGDRVTVISKFELWLKDGTSFNCPDATEPRRQWILTHLTNLKGKRLGCFCAPQRCHGDVLAKLADAL